MSAYRDDLEAARARSAGLEEENEALREREEELAEKEAELEARARELGDAEAEAKAETKEARAAKKKAQKLARRIAEERAEREREEAERASEEEEEAPPTNDRVMKELELARLDREWDREERALIAQYFPRRRHRGRVLQRSDLSLMRITAAVAVAMFTGFAWYASTLPHMSPIFWFIPPLVAVLAFVGIQKTRRGVEAMERARAGYEDKRAAVLQGGRTPKKRRKPHVRVADGD